MGGVVGAENLGRVRAPAFCRRTNDLGSNSEVGPKPEEGHNAWLRRVPPRRRPRGGCKPRGGSIQPMRCLILFRPSRRNSNGLRRLLCQVPPKAVDQRWNCERNPQWAQDGPGQLPGMQDDGDALFSKSQEINRGGLPFLVEEYACGCSDHDG